MTTGLGSPRSPAARSSRAVAAVVAGMVAGAGAGLVADAGTSAVAAGIVSGAIAVAAGWPDLRERRIPNSVVLAGLGATVTVGLAVAIGGDRPIGGSVVGGTGLAGGLTLVLHLARPASLGFGDVKLASVLGALMGVVHWSLAAVTLGFASLIGAAGAAGFTGWRRSIPFGACMGVAAVGTIAAAGFLRDWAGLW